MQSLTAAASLVLCISIASGDPTWYGKRYAQLQMPFVECEPCVTPDCNSDAPCPFGDYVDHCNRRHCYKGPDEECGRHFGRGKCGAGLFCNKCGLCQGCSSIMMLCSTKDVYCKYM